MIDSNNFKFLKAIAWYKKVFRFLKKHFESNEPITQMTKGDLFEIIKEVKSEKAHFATEEEVKENRYQKRFRKQMRLLLLIIFTFGTLVGLFGPGMELYKEYQENLETKQAIENLNNVASTMYYRENSPEVALKIIEKSISIDDKNAETLYLKSFIESMLTVELIKNLDRPYNKEELLQAQTAMANAEFILESNSKEQYSKAYLIKAQTYFALNDNKRALQEIEKAIKYDKNEIFYKIRKASILVENGEYNKALKLLEKLDDKYDGKDKKYIYLWKGITYFELSKISKTYEEEIRYYKLMKEEYLKALEVDERFHLAMINLGKTYAQSNDGDKSNNISDRKKAIELYKKVLKLRPGNKETYFLLGMSYGSIDKYEKSELYFKKALEQDSNYYSANLWLGNVYFEIEDYESALKYYNKALQLNPSSTGTYFRRAKTNQKLKKYKDAIKDYLEVIDESRDEYYIYRSYVNRALISIENSNFKNAKSFLDEAKKFESEVDPVYYRTLFKYFKSLNDFENALLAINKAISGSNKLKNSLRYKKAFYLYSNDKYVQSLNVVDEIKASTIEKSGLLEKVLKLEYKICTKLKDKKRVDKTLQEIKKLDPNFK